MKLSPLLSILQQINQSIVSYQSLGQVIQANAEGNRIKLTYKDEINCSTTAEEQNQQEKIEELFVKQVIASNYHQKSWADLRRTLIYARTEVRFYKEFIPDFKNSFTPICFHAEIYLNGLVQDDEEATDVDHAPPEGWPSEDDRRKEFLQQNEGRGYLILESICTDSYVQESPITLEQATKCLQAVAKMHASSWENKILLEKAAKRLSDKGGSYHLRIRNPKEYHGLVSSWEGFCSNFQHLNPELFAREGIIALGQRVYDIAEYVSDQLSPSSDDPFATIVHGDYKAMNVFLPIEDANEEKQKEALIIDFASTGLGFGMSDVAMHIPHAVHPKDAANGGETQLLNSYLKALEKARSTSINDQDNDKKKKKTITSYPRDVALRHYRLASIDYFRFILGRFWKSASVESFEKRKNSRNTVLVNRNAEAAFAFIERVESYLSEFENEYTVCLK